MFNIADANLPIRYVALYQSKGLFKDDAQIAYYGEVKRIQKVKRGEITEIPCEPYRANEEYYRFEIRRWRKLANPIQISRGIRRPNYTNEFLLKHAQYSQELNLRSAEQYRLLMELKRYQFDVTVIQDEDQPQGFIFGNQKMLFQDGEIKLIQDGRLITGCTIDDFLRRPNIEYRNMMRLMKRKSF